eukprot:CCRYP_007523-RB/>CCRYP_007523-RB protein AED:0.44 eAED:0.62 QI:0/0/0/1/0/0/2/0/250
MNVLQKSLPAGSYAALSRTGSAQSTALEYILNQDVYVYDWDGIAAEDETATRNFLQRYVLTTLYYAFGGSNWDKSENWRTKYDVCTWYGVGCDGVKYGTAGADSSSGEGVVTSIDLHQNNLKGTLIGDLAALTGLTDVELHSNYIKGSIPPAIYGMKGLSVLFLDDNYLSGSISTSVGKLSNLSRLTLSDNEMTGSIPTEIGGMTSLKVLDLSTNELSGELPSEIGELTSITELVLFSNNLNGTLHFRFN